MLANRLLLSVLTAVIATVGLSKIAQAGTQRHDVQDADYINLANSFESVGSLSLRGISGEWNCSGTLVGSRWLLTAAHCLEDQQSGLQDVRRATFSIGGSTYSVQGGVKHNGWLTSNRNLAQGFDIAMLQLRGTVNNVTAATLFTGTNENNQIGTYVGFGNSGTGISGQLAGTFGTKRAGQNLINLGSQIGATDQLLYSNFTDPRSDPSALALEYNIAQGDSGGALFINGQLAGVNSVIYNANANTRAGDYGDLSLVTRVSSFSNWIQNVMTVGFPRRRGVSAIGNTTTLANAMTASGSGAEAENFDELLDLVMYEDIYNNTAKVPEPSSLFGLLSLGGLLAWKSRCRQSKAQKSSSSRS